MTSVNVTTTKNTVTVNGETRVVTVKTQGPQGPAFSDGDKGDVTVSSNGTAISINNSAVTSAKIADGAIVNADINASAAIALSKLATGALPTAITVTSANISDLSIVDADISGSAAISLSKLATGALPTAITVTSANISDLSIVNADINASAAIAGTKISPDFGSQNIVTTGTGATGALGVTGDITVSGTVDGRDVAADGTKLDGIETGATADQTASEIKTAYESNSDTNAFTDTLLSKLNGIESNATADQTKSDIDALGIAASTAATLANARTIAGTSFDGSANIDISYTNLTNKLSVGDGGLTQNNFTDALKTKLDGVETGATADQTASEIVALIADQTIAPSTIDMEDNEKIKLGTGDDLEIYHDGSNSIIKNTTNDLTLQTTGDDLLLKASDNIALYVQGTENAINCIGNGAVDLFFNNSKKFATTSTGVTVTGNIAVTGTVDGRDVATDGTKLDGIEASATADQTAAEIKTLLDSNGIVNSNVDASAAIAGTKISPNFGSQNVVTTGTFGSGDITILDASPSLRFTENDANPDYKLIVNNGVFKIVDETNSNAERFVVNTDGHIDVTGNLDIGAGLDVTGNITVTGTVDGVDIATRDTLFGGLTSSSGVLTNGVTATTQSASDNSTKVATTAYTDTAIANLVDSAPGTLNTLNELAAALGDDANFSTTVTNSIATKLPLAGGTLTGNLKIVSDTLKLFLGASEEMQVFHDGTSSLIKDTRDSGKVRIQADNFDFIDKDASGVILSATSFGLSVTGNITVSGTVDGRDIATDGTKLDGIESNATADQTASEIVALVADQTIAPSTIDMEDNERIKLGTGDDLQIYHDGSNSNVRHQGTGDLNLTTTTGNIQLLGSSDKMLVADKDGAVELYFDNSKKLETTSTGVKVQNTGASALLLFQKDTDALGYLESQTSKIVFGSSNDHPVTITQNSGTALNIDTSKNIQIPNDNARLQIGASQDLELFHNGTNSFILSNSHPLILESDSLILRSDANEKYFEGTSNGAVELYYDNSKKFETISTGVKIAGNIRVGNGSNLDIKNDNGSETLAKFINNAEVELYYDNSKKFETTSYGAQFTDNVKFDNPDTAGRDLTWEADNDSLHWEDNTKATFGAGNDLQIYHDGNHSRISDVGTGKLILETNGSEIQLNKGTTENMIKCFTDGAVELYFNGSKKAFTYADGLHIDTGVLRGDDNALIKLGNGGDLQIYHDSSTNDGFIKELGTGRLQIWTSSLHLKNQAGDEINLVTNENGNCELWFDNSKKLETKSNGINVTGRLLATGSSGYGLIFNDDVKISLGNSNDLQIYHDGSNSYIEDAGTGSLILKTNHFVANAGAYSFMNAANSETLIYAVENGSVQLYHDNSKKFETWTSGARLPSDNNVLAIGAGDDLRFWHNATNSIIRNATGELQIQSNSLRLANYNATETYITATENGAVNLFYDDSKKFETTSTGVSVTGNIAVSGTVDGVDVAALSASVSGFLSNVVEDTSPQLGGELQTNGNDISFADNDRATFGAGDDFRIFHNGSDNFISGTGNIYLKSSGFLDIRSDGNETMIKATPNGAVELYHDGSLKANTRSDGFEIKQHLTMGDSDEIRLGNSSDLKIYHDGSVEKIESSGGGLHIRQISNSDIHIHAGADSSSSNNRIVARSAGQAELYYSGNKKFETTSDGVKISGAEGVEAILSFEPDEGDNASDKFRFRASDSAGFFLENGSSNETSIKANFNGSVELYHDNSLKLYTMSSGVTVSGDLLSSSNVKVNDNGNLIAGSGNDLQIYHDGSNSYIKNSTGMMRIQGTQFQVKDEDGNESLATFIPQGAVELYYDNSKKFETTSVGINVTGSITADDLRTDNSQTFFLTTASDFRFRNTGGTERMRIDTSGDVAIGTTTTTHKFTVVNDAIQQVGQFLAGSTSYDETVLQAACSRNVTNGSYNHFKCSINGVADKMRVRDSGNVQNTNNSYGSLSDERLKENIVDATSQWNDIKNIRVRKFNFKEGVDPAKPTLLGVIAQEAELVCPNLIETDVQLQAGEEKEYKSFKYSVLYMKAIKCLQEAMAKIEVLETKVATLEGA